MIVTHSFFDPMHSSERFCPALYACRRELDTTARWPDSSTPDVSRVASALWGAVAEGGLHAPTHAGRSLLAERLHRVSGAGPNLVWMTPLPFRYTNVDRVPMGRRRLSANDFAPAADIRFTQNRPDTGPYATQYVEWVAGFTGIWRKNLQTVVPCAVLADACDTAPNVRPAAMSPAHR